MTSGSYQIYGLGIGVDDLRYIGWTQRSVDQETEHIVSDFIQSGNGTARAMGAADQARISIFEIESVASIDDALESTVCWCGYFNSLGLDVKCCT